MTRREALLRTSGPGFGHALAAFLAVATGALTAQEPATSEAAKHAKREALERALRDLEEGPEPAARDVAPQLPQTDTGGALGPFELIDLSFDVLFAGGTSTERDESLQSLQGGGHDPRKRGFTLQEAELGLKGAVDPYFRAEAYMIYFIDPLEGESRFELEEAFVTTTSLPRGLEIEAGQFFTEFGRHNPRHPHEWEWLDQPIVFSRLFGPDGMRGPGARVGWLTPLPWFAELHLGVQNANGETMASFLANDELYEERAIGGRPFTDREVRSLADLVYLVRLLQSWDVGESTTIALGGSALFGPNATGDDADTAVYGADLVVRWTDGVGGREAKELIWTTEVAWRDFRAAPFAADDGSGGVVQVPGETLRDWGCYTQLGYRFGGPWRAGLRFEQTGGSGRGWDADAVSLVSRSSDPFRDDRYRVSPMLQWQATEYSRLRLQYNYDDADHLPDGDAHSVWLGVEVGLGAHPAHAF